MIQQSKILIIEDDTNIARLLIYNLQQANFLCRHSLTAVGGLNILKEEKFDLVILDIMLPGGIDGLDACRQIKQNYAIAVIILTAKGEEADRVIGFELGADDYIVKPFSPRELVLRVKAVLRRRFADVSDSQIGADNNLTVLGIHMDVIRHKVTVDGLEVNLTSMEFKLLLVFMRRKGRLQSREKLLQDVWNIDADINTRTIDTHIKRLRRKLGAYGHLLETVRGFGYRMKDI